MPDVLHARVRHGPASVLALDGLVAVPCQQAAQLLAVRGPHPDAGPHARVDGLPHGRVGEQASPAEDDQVVGEGRRLGHQMAGDQDGAALPGEPAEQLPYPDDAFGVESVGRLVQQQHRGVAEKRSRDAEPLPHAQRVRSHPVPCDRGESRLLQDLVHPASRDAVARRQCAQVVARGAGAVRGARVEQRAHLTQRLAQRGVGPSPDRGGAGRGPVQPQHEPHGGGLPGAVGPEEPGDPAGPHAERQPVHGASGPVLLGEVLYVDAGHGTSVAVSGPPSLPRAGKASPPLGGAPLSVPPGTMTQWTGSCAR